MHWTKRAINFYIALTLEAQLISSDYVEKYSLWSSFGLGRRVFFWVCIRFGVAFTVTLKFRLLIWAREICVWVWTDYVLDFGWWNDTDVLFYTFGNMQLSFFFNVLTAVIKKTKIWIKTSRYWDCQWEDSKSQVHSVLTYQQRIWFSKTTV